MQEGSYSLPGAIKYVVQLPWNVFMMKLVPFSTQEGDMYGRIKNSGPVVRCGPKHPWYH